MSIDLQKNICPFSHNSELSQLYRSSLDLIVFLCLRPEWEAKIKKRLNSTLFNQNPRHIIDNIGKEFCSKNFEMSIYIFAGMIECSNLNVSYILKHLGTIESFESYIKNTVFQEQQFFTLFSRIDISRAKVDVKNLCQLLSHIICAAFQEQLKKEYETFVDLSFFRYQNNFIVSSVNLQDINDFINKSQDILSHMGLEYNWKHSRILTKQQTLRFLGFEISPTFLLVKTNIYNQVILNASKEEKKLILSKIRYILRSRHEDGKTRAKTNMPLTKAIALINPLVINWRKYYVGFVPTSTLEKLDWLLNEKIYRWYIKRLKKNRVTHWNKRCIQIVRNKKRIAQDSYVLELFNSSTL
nr:mat1b [Pseudoerythrocladia kornmannii]